MSLFIHLLQFTIKTLNSNNDNNRFIKIITIQNSRLHNVTMFRLQILN